MNTSTHLQEFAEPNFGILTAPSKISMAPSIHEMARALDDEGVVRTMLAFAIVIVELQLGDFRSHWSFSSS